MIIEFVTPPKFNFHAFFAEALGVPIINNEFKIPSWLGVGSVCRVDLEEDYKLTICHFRLKEDLILKRIGSKEPAAHLGIIFYNHEEPASLVTSDGEQRYFSRYNDMAIQIGSNTLDSTITFPAYTEIYNTTITLTPSRLQSLLIDIPPNALIDAIINPKEPYLFYESMGTETQLILKQITEPKSDDGFAKFFYTHKAEALLYNVFNQLYKRKSASHNPVNKADAEKLFIIREAILSNLSEPPSLPGLAKLGGISETKMNILFRQVFGDSIYNYYQTARMEEAAYLLRHKNYSVSEAGYQLGFSNLSHFTRLFERHHQQKPKKYALGG